MGDHRGEWRGWESVSGALLAFGVKLRRQRGQFAKNRGPGQPSV